MPQTLSCTLSYFYPRPPRGGRRLRPLGKSPRAYISIHALREEGDERQRTSNEGQIYFYPRPPRGGRRATMNMMYSDYGISIHALREEGDLPPPVRSPLPANFYPRPPRGGRRWNCRSRHCGRYFYPRPPRGGRLVQKFHEFFTAHISIHALREEGDCHDAFCLVKPADISIHALREEGDISNWCTKCQIIQFLSTPSARRATAKTERKPSAFVSLYTSLHKLQRGACKTNRRITPLLVQTAGIPVRSVRENYVRCLFALAGHQKISTLSCANSGCSPTCSTLVW